MYHQLIQSVLSISPFNDEGIIISMELWHPLKDDLEIDCICDSSDISITLRL